MSYVAIKAVHQAAVALSLAGFAARGIGALCNAAWVRGRASRTVPHVVDSVLLLSAVVLAGTLRLNPLLTPWLLAKLIGLLVYIGLGVVALAPRRPAGVRIAAWIGAMATAGWIVSVAVSKNPAGLFSLL